MENIFKKSLSLVLSAALCLTALVGCLTVSAEGASATVTVGSVEVNSDATTAKVPVTITASGDGIAAAMFELKVDTTKINLSGLWENIATNIKTESDSIGINVSVSNDGDNVTTVASEDVYRFIVEGVDPTSGENVSIKQFTNASFDLTFNIASGATGENAIEFVKDAHAQACNAGKFNIETGKFDGSDEALVPLTGTNGKVTVKDDTVYEDPNLKIRSAGITIANGFALNFKVRKTMETSLGYTDIYLLFQKPRYDTEGNLIGTVTTTVTADLRTEDSDNVENYIYTLSGIQPQELGTEVTATIYGNKDGHVYTGATVKYSVLRFATTQLKNSTDANLKTACADMINFAGAIQRYGKYNTANPIEDKAKELLGSDSWKSLATESITRELVNAQKNTPFDGATVRVRSAGIIFEDKVVLYFNCADLGAGVTTLTNPENYYLHVSYKSVTGVAREFDIEIDSNYQAKLDTLYSTELGTVVTAYMVDRTSGAQVSNSVDFSIETFISNNLTNASHGECCATLCKYGDSVRKYAGLN